MLTREQLDAFLYLAYGSLPLIIARPELHKLGFVKEGALKKSLENSNHLLPVLSEVTLLSKKDHQVMHLLFDEKMGGTIDGPLNWYRTRKVNHDEDKGKSFFYFFLEKNDINIAIDNCCNHTHKFPRPDIKDATRIAI